MRDTGCMRLRMAIVMAVLSLLLALWVIGVELALAYPGATQACVTGPHSGVLTGTQTWCLSDSPHRISGNVVVPGGMTLTVEAGVIVQGDDGRALLVEGYLVALGTETQPISFTSSADSGGAQWAGIGVDGGKGQLRHTTVRYAGDRNDVSTAVFNNGSYHSALTAKDGTLHLDSVSVYTVTGDYDHGLLIDDSTVVMTDTRFSGIGDGGQRDVAIRVNGPGTTLTMSGCTFTGNTRDRVRLEAGAMMGHDTTLYAQPRLDGYELSADFIVPPTLTLTIEPGVTVMTHEALHQYMIVRGRLEALGTSTQPITFTSALNTAPGQWSGIGFDGGSGHLKYTTVRYAGEPNSVSKAIMNNNGYYRGALSVQNGTLQLENVTLSDVGGASGYDHGLLIGDSRVWITDTLFTRVGDGGQHDVAMRVDGPDTELTMSGCTFTGNTADRVVLQPGAMMGHDTTLTPQPVLEGYEFREDFTVPPTVTLTLEPGVTLMGAQWKALLVEGHLEALGTATQPITFTSALDSGSDQWAGIAVDGGSGHLRYAKVRYAGDRNDLTDALVGPHDHSNLAIRNGTLRLEAVTVHDIATGDYDYGLIAANSHLIISDTLFTAIGDGDNRDVPMRLQGVDTVLDMSGCTFTSNTTNRVWLDTNAMMGHDTTLAAQPALEGYEFREDFTVPPTVTLTVEPGVMVMGTGSRELLVRGHLDALGTEMHPITFTSATNTGAAQWSGLVFDGSQGVGTGHLRHATVRYGGHGNSVLAATSDYHSGSNVTVNGVLTGEVRLEYVTLASEYHWDGWHAFGDHGLYVGDSQVVVADSIVEDSCDAGSDDSGVYVTGDSTVWIEDSLIQLNDAPGLVIAGDTAFVNVSGSSIINNAGDGVRNKGAADVVLSGDAENGNAIHDNTGFGANQAGAGGQIIATYNWWGDASGPTHTDNPAGTGEGVTDRVRYDPWLTAPPTPPAVATQLVQATGPLHVSPGDTVNLGLYLNNFLTETMTHTVAVAQLPDDVEYLMSTGGGRYWPQRHQVVWSLGNAAPHTTWKAAAIVRPLWGLPLHLHMDFSALVASDNRPHAAIELADYWAYTELDVVFHRDVSESELATELAAHPDLDTLYQEAEGQGFFDYGSTQMEQLSDGRERLVLVMIHTGKPGERIDLYHDSGNAVAVHTTPAYEEIYTPEAGLRFIFDTGEVESWGTFPDALAAQFLIVTPCATTGCDYFGYNDCLRNCMIHSIPSGQFKSQYSSACGTCYASGERCQQCAWHMYLLRTDTIRNSLDFCYDTCDQNVDNWKCDESTRDCVSSHTYIETPCIDCEYRTDLNVWQTCGPNTRCINNNCEPIHIPETDNHEFEILVAGDPNEMRGPSVAIPGQGITYTIAYENVGDGNAHGVYVISHLPAELDPTSLQVAEGGSYLPGNRTLIWDIGSLGPGEGGEVQFEVQVPSSVPGDTVIIANATVYFPSVPETTPTNDVITIVGDVVAYAQRVETLEGTPVAITLSGTSPTGNPLIYTVADEPINGELSGTAPDLTYTPADTFEGLDTFAFSVEDGVSTSLPAEVSIQVKPGEETIPPEVILTAPANGATDVKVYATAAYTGTYYPTVWALFNEPISSTTVTTETLTVTDQAGRRLAGIVTYDGTSSVVRFTLGEALSRNRAYTAMITSEVRDTSGNAMTADYVWSFRAEGTHVYLPLVVRQD